MPTKKKPTRKVATKKEDVEMIRLGKDIYAVLMADADRSQRSATKQLRYILLKYYGVDKVAMFDPAEVIRQLRKGEELKENGPESNAKAS